MMSNRFPGIPYQRHLFCKSENMQMMISTSSYVEWHNKQAFWIPLHISHNEAKQRNVILTQAYAHMFKIHVKRGSTQNIV